MSYRVLVSTPGGHWYPLHPGRRYTLTAALNAFDLEVVQQRRGVRVVRGMRQVCVYQPGREQAA